MSAPTIEARLYRCDYAGNRAEDISDIVIEGRAAMNPENDQTWSFDATVTWAGYQRLTPYLDWIAPELIVTWPNGRVDSGQLGLYLVIESPVIHRETSATVALRAMDPLWLVARQEFVSRLDIAANSEKDRKLRQILDSTVLTDDLQGRRRFAIPDTGKRFRKAQEYPRSKNRLAICNELAQGMGCYNLWTTPLGIITTKRMGEARLKQRTPVKTYSAHVPDSIALADHQLSANHPFSEVVGAIDTAPFDDSLLNEIAIITDDPGLERIHVRRRVRNPKNPRLTQKRRRHMRKRYNRMIDDDATAGEVADALLDELSTKNRTARLTVLPSPSIDFARETIDCYIWNAAGDEVALGQYAVLSVSYGFTPKSGTMELNIGRIDSVDTGLDDDG